MDKLLFGKYLAENSTAERQNKSLVPSNKKETENKPENKIKLNFRKSHPRRDWAVKKVGVPTGAMLTGTGIAYGSIVAANMIAGSGILIPVTSNAFINFASTLSIGAVGGLALTPAIILTKNAITKAWYNRYGNIKKILKSYDKDYQKEYKKANETDRERMRELGDAPRYEHLSKVLSEKLGKLEAKIEKSHERILELRSGKKITAPFRALARTVINVVNRNRIHHIQKCAVELADMYSNVSKDTNLINRRACQRAIYSSLDNISTFIDRDLERTRDYINKYATKKVMVENADIYSETLRTIQRVERPKKLREILQQKKNIASALVRGELHIIDGIKEHDDNIKEDVPEVPTLAPDTTPDPRADDQRKPEVPTENPNPEQTDVVKPAPDTSANVPNHCKFYFEDDSTNLIISNNGDNQSGIEFLLNKEGSYKIVLHSGDIKDYCDDEKLTEAVKKLLDSNGSEVLPEVANLAFIISRGNESVLKFVDEKLTETTNDARLQILTDGKPEFRFKKRNSELFMYVDDIKVETVEEFDDIRNRPIIPDPIDPYTILPKNGDQVTFDTSEDQVSSAESTTTTATEAVATESVSDVQQETETTTTESNGQHGRDIANETVAEFMQNELTERSNSEALQTSSVAQAGADATKTVIEDHVSSAEAPVAETTSDASKVVPLKPAGFNKVVLEQKPAESTEPPAQVATVSKVEPAKEVGSTTNVTNNSANLVVKTLTRRELKKGIKYSAKYSDGRKIDYFIPTIRRSNEEIENDTYSVLVELGLIEP